MTVSGLTASARPTGSTLAIVTASGRRDETLLHDRHLLVRKRGAGIEIRAKHVE
jgi:hypothetical protein